MHSVSITQQIIAIFLFMSPGSFFMVRMLCLNVCSRRSAWPLVVAWYGADRRWVVPLLFMKCAKVLLTNVVPLSLTSCLQRIFRAKKTLWHCLIVFSDLIDFIIKTSCHLKCPSIMMKNILLIKVLENQHARIPMVKSAIPMDSKTLLQAHFAAFDNTALFY